MSRTALSRWVMNFRVAEHLFEIGHRSLVPAETFEIKERHPHMLRKDKS
jgi:hypothetical protein